MHPIGGTLAVYNPVEPSMAPGYGGTGAAESGYFPSEGEFYVKR